MIILYDNIDQLNIIYITSKTPAGRQATEGRSRNALWNAPGNALWNAPGRGAFRLGYLPISSDSDSFANRLSSSSYVDPPSFRLQLTPDIHHPESVPGSVPKERLAAGRPAGHTFPEYIVMGNLRLQSVLYYT